MTIGDVVYWLVWAVFRVVAHLLWRYRIVGRWKVPRAGPLLIVSNHPSWYDPLSIGGVLPRRVWFLAKRELFKWPIMGGLCHLTGQIPVRRGASDRIALEKALAYLRQGRAVMIFPEGRVEKRETLLPAHNGVAMLALRSGATILPVAHTGTERVLHAWFPRLCVEIGEPFKPRLPEGISRKVGLQLLTEEIMERIAAMLPPEERGAYAAFLHAASENSSATALPEMPMGID